MKFRLLILFMTFLLAFASMGFSSLGVHPVHAAALADGTLAPKVDAGDGGCTGGGSMGIFQGVYDALAPLARNLWAFLVAIIVVLATLGGLFFALQGTGGVVMGGTKPTASAIMGLVGLVVVVLIVFLLLPNLGSMLCSFQPKPPF